MIVLLILGCSPSIDPAVVLTLGAPAEGAQVSGLESVAASWSAEPEGKTSLTADGEVLSNHDGRVHTAPWNTDSVTPGFHLVGASGADSRVLHRVSSGEGSAHTIEVVPAHGSVVCRDGWVRAVAEEVGGEVELAINGDDWTVAGGGRVVLPEPGASGWDVFARVRVNGEITAMDAVHLDPSENPDCGGASVEVTEPASGSVVGDGFLVSAVAIGGARDVAVVMDGVLLGVGEPGWSGSVAPGALREGWHRVRAIANEATAAAEDEVAVLVDLTPPGVVLTGLSADEVVRGSRELTVTGSDGIGVASVELVVDGASICGAPAATVSCVWNVGAGDSGPHLVEAVAVDRAGWVTRSAVSATSDLAPSVAILNPIDGARVDGITSITVVSADDLAIPVVTISIDGQPASSASTTELVAAWDTCAEVPGTHEVSASVHDSTGGNAEVSVEVTTGRALTVEPGAVAGDLAAEPRLFASTAASSPVYLVEWSVDGVAVGDAAFGEETRLECASGCATGCARWFAAPTLDGVLPGSHTLAVTAWTVDGERAEASTLVTLTGDLDGDGLVDERFGGDDCDDTDVAVFPGAVEACNDADDDCDGLVDEDFDVDADGYTSVACAAGTDCDDLDPSVNPGATEVCDGADNDCDGTTDQSADSWLTTLETATGTSTDSAEALSFVGVAFFVDEVTILLSADADISSSDSSTATTWALYEAIAIDEAFLAVTTSSTTGPTDLSLLPGRVYALGFWSDNATSWASGAPGVGDGITLLGKVADPTWPPEEADTEARNLVLDASVAPAIRMSLQRTADADADADTDGTTEWCGDCDDANATSLPGATEACDGADNDCDGAAAGEEDGDADGVRACNADCDDGDPARFPGAAEACDGVDNDCDGAAADEEDADLDGVRVCEADCDDADASVGAETYYADDDGDGYGDASDVATVCPPPSGYVADASDCDDTNASVSPAAPEACNHADDDCDGAVDEDWADADADGAAACRDCDDSDPDVSPDAPEVCGDVTDDDCDGVAPMCQESGSATAPLAASGIAEGVESSEASGYALAAGDLDGDGVADVAIGAPENDDAGSGAGIAYVLNPALGTFDVDDGPAQVRGVAAGDKAGSSLAWVPDVTGDGEPDLLIGAPYADNGGTSSGCAYLLSGPLAGVIGLSAADATLPGDSASDYAGLGLAALPDTDGDGVAGVAIAAYGDASSGSATGTIYLLEGPLSGTTALASGSMVYGESTSSKTGQALADAGDLDGDGLSDLLIGASGYGSNKGATYLVFGGSGLSGSLSAADARWVGEDFADESGNAVGAGGDLDGDGLDDALVGASKTKADGWYGGSVYVVSGPGTSVTSLSSANGRVDGAADYELLGSAVNGPGDVDGDGADDLVVGAYGHADGASTYSGAVYLLYGPMPGAWSVPGDGYQLVGEDASDNLGWALTSGDFDVDGFPDLALGAYGNDGGRSNAGSTYFLFMGP